MTPPSIIPKVEAIDVETSPMPNEDNKTLNKDNSTNGQSDTNDRRRTSTRKRLAKKFFGDFFSPQQNQASKRGKVTTILQSQDPIDASGGKPKEVSPTLEDNALCDDFENQPISKWVEGIRTQSTEPSPVNAVEQPMEENQETNQNEEISEKYKETEVSIPKIVDKHPVLLMEPRNLPFVKNSHLWKIVEEMDALKKVPQNPHFQPLEQIKEPLREGKAIGYMVKFGYVLGRISELKFGDPKSVADDLLEALAELETHGFNVWLLKDRVAEFIEAKGKEENLLSDVKELSSQIQGRHKEKGEIEEEIDEIKEEMRMLEEKLEVYVLGKGKVEDDILALGEQLNETEECIENLGHGFDGGSSVFLCI